MAIGGPTQRHEKNRLTEAARRARKRSKSSTACLLLGDLGDLCGESLSGSKILISRQDAKGAKKEFNRGYRG
jgi:hypothetical protein